MFPTRGRGGMVLPGVTPYPESPLANVADAINSFLTAYTEMQDKEKKEAEQRFLKGMELKKLGIKVDDKQLAKDAQKAGLPLDFTGESVQQSPPPIPSSTQPVSGAPTVAQGATLPPGPLPHGSTQSMGWPSSEPPAFVGGMQGAPGEGFWRKVKGALRGKPPITNMGPLTESFNQVAQEAMAQRQLDTQIRQAQLAGMQLEQMKPKIVIEALKGDLRAQDMARQAGWLATSKYDDLIKLYMEATGSSRKDAAEATRRLAYGINELEALEQKRKTEMAKLEYDQYLDVVKQANEFLKVYPDAGPLAYAAAVLQFNRPGSPEHMETLKELQKWRVTDQDKWEEEKKKAAWNRAMDVERLGLDKRRTEISAGHLGVARERLEVDKQQQQFSNELRKDELGLQVLNSKYIRNNERFQQLFKMMTESFLKGEDDDSRNAIQNEMLSIIRDSPEFTTKIGGFEIKVNPSSLSQEDVGWLFNDFKIRQRKLTPGEQQVLSSEAGLPSVSSDKEAAAALISAPSISPRTSGIPVEPFVGNLGLTGSGVPKKASEIAGEAKMKGVDFELLYNMYKDSGYNIIVDVPSYMLPSKSLKGAQR